MTRSRGHEVTELLRSSRQGDAAALDRLVPLVDPELRRAATLMRQILVDHARRKRGAKRGGAVVGAAVSATAFGI